MNSVYKTLGDEISDAVTN